MHVYITLFFIFQEFTHSAFIENGLMISWPSKKVVGQQDFCAEVENSETNVAQLHIILGRGKVMRNRIGTLVKA